MTENLTTKRQSNGMLLVYDFSETVERTGATSVLDVLLAITECDQAHLYWMDPAGCELRLFNARPKSEDRRVPRVRVQFPDRTKEWLESLREPEVLNQDDERFSCFPEAAGALELMVSPLRTESSLAGAVTLAYSRRGSIKGSAADWLGKLTQVLAAVTRDPRREREVVVLRDQLRSARRENSSLEQRLADRKVIERAKGLLQAQNGWLEGEAYFHIRRASRQQRTPMAVIAQRIIDISGQEPALMTA